MASRLPAISSFYNYSRLVNNSTNYAKRMKRLSNNILTEVVRPMDYNSASIVQRVLQKPIDTQPDIVNYYDYIRHPETDKLMSVLRYHGLFRDEHADFNEEMERLREMRGKGRKRFFVRHAEKKKK
uniref:Small ribosomal subunit protein mS33 n=1 Tax=Hirondellea gigas TaxID=1518452 RepID=A0A2P2I0F0_9CRUS